MVKNPPANAGDARDMSSNPGSGRPLGGANGNPLQYSCLGNPMDRGAWWATVHGVTQSQTWLRDSAPTEAAEMWGGWACVEDTETGESEVRPKRPMERSFG